MGKEYNIRRAPRFSSFLVVVSYLLAFFSLWFICCLLWVSIVLPVIRLLIKYLYESSLH